MAEVTDETSRHLLSRDAYNSVWQLRVDAWSSIADVTKRLHDASLPQDRRADLEGELGALLDLVAPIENYWAFPGPQRVGQLRELLVAREYELASRTVEAIARRLVGDPSPAERDLLYGQGDDERPVQPVPVQPVLGRPSFEVLVVADLTNQDADQLCEELRRLRRLEDAFTYELVFVPSFEDALVAVQLNFNVQACVIRPEFQLRSHVDLHRIYHFLPRLDKKGVEQLTLIERILLLGEGIGELRPELDLYLVGHASIEAIAGRVGRRFHRVFLRQDALELHLSILRGVGNRYQTPFFTALRDYSRQPIGVFHALPISRGKSVVNSPWISDMAEFYGLNIFLAETSATSGGLDSLLDPVGPIKKAQELAARAFGAQRTFFVTNGTSTANKIVLQSIITPGEIVLVDRNCHKSHHYALMLAGAQVNYLDAYPLDLYSIYGAVPLSTIKQQLLAYRRAGRLDQVKILALTNCTFDGIVYDVERVMEECLAIKPDLVFLWDEAWFAFAGFHPMYRRRTAMATARRLQVRYRDPAYQRRHAAQAAELAEGDDETWLRTRLLPDPAKVRLRVYATQSTHKTLTALRQGSMIHLFDQDFGRRNEEAFREAYMTHTSTSPNYQILASLDVGRRQVELEGFELVQKQVELSMVLREVVENHPLLKRYFQILTTKDLIPADYRQSGIGHVIQSDMGQMQEAWEHDEFVLDPSRVTLYIGLTGVDGDTFKHEYLMNRYGIQVNKTSRNTVLFMTHIGTTRSSVAYLIEVLVMLAQELEDEVERMGPIDRGAHARRVTSLTRQPPPLPDFSAFHPRFRGDPQMETPEGDMRQAFFMAYDDQLCEYLTPEETAEQVNRGREIVSATFVTPYPPGFPILVPGQVISGDILAFMRALDTREIHGYLADIGYRVFTEEALASAPSGPSPQPGS
jgi:arginine decarboxylase